MKTVSNITTYQKISMDPLCAKDEQILIEDVAHALSLLCRANGHFPHFYSVAQHSLNCMREAEARGYSKTVQLGCLLHDASEAYLSDITRPIKPHLIGYFEIEKRLQNQIFQKWISPSLTEEELEQITQIDDAILYYEFVHLMAQKLFDEEPTLLSTPTVDFVEFTTIEQAFLQAFYLLKNE